MSADHYHLILQVRICSGNLGNGVEAMFVVPGEFSVNVHFYVHGHVCFQQSVDASEVLNCDYCARD